MDGVERFLYSIYWGNLDLYLLLSHETGFRYFSMVWRWFTVDFVYCTTWATYYYYLFTGISNYSVYWTIFNFSCTQLSSCVFRDCLSGRFDAGQLLRPLDL